MSKKIKISIPAKQGEQHFFVGRKTLSLLLATTLLSPVIAGVAVYQLQKQEQSAEQTFARTMHQLSNREQDIAQLTENLQQLTNSNLHLNQELEDRNSQLLILNKRIIDVESVLGIAEVAEPDSNPQHLQERVDVAAINSAVRATMFRLIPNDTPLEYNRVSSSFGRRQNPITGKRHLHTGIDLTCKRGEPVYAPADGVVESVRPSKKGFGNFLILRHSFGFSTSYAHLNSFKVKRGEFVSKGDPVATCGNSGNSTGPHLHYETRFLGRYLNPQYLMDWRPEQFETLFEKEKKVKWAPLVKLIDNVVRLQVNLTNHPYVDDSLDTAASQTTATEEAAAAQPSVQ